MNDNDAAPASRDDKTPKKTRTRSGCLVCRRRRRKCDEQRPTCSNCRGKGLVCEWGMKITFRADNASKIDAEHPSMKAGSRKRAREFEIVDVTSEIEKGYTLSCAGELADSILDADTPQTSNTLPSSSSKKPDVHTPFHSTSDPSLYQTPTSATTSLQNHSPYSDGLSQYMPIESPVFDVSIVSDNGPYIGEAGRQARRNAPIDDQALNDGGTLRSRNDTEDAADLLAFRYLPSHRRSGPNIAVDEQTSMPQGAEEMSSGDLNHGHTLLGHDFDTDDGIFLPGSVYREFHSTLRDHLIYTARSTVPTRHGTPEVPEHGLDSRSGADYFRTSDVESDTIQLSRIPEITPQREYTLWKSWIDEIAPWLDKFDNKRHFEHHIPMMARNTPHLRYSILALSARQNEMKHKSKSLSESLALYQQAIHLLLPELQTKDTAVIASCVILCVLEMMSCSPKEWRRHLEGCAAILEAVGINGFVGGVEEALFWCFARIDLCGALISEDVTLIPVERWASDITRFKGPLVGFDTYANYAVFLCAQCVAYLKNRSEVSREASLGRWAELLDLLDDWFEQRPEEMKPILTIPALHGERQSPFPTVFYGNGSAVSGNQLYHTAALLMLQAKPADWPKVQRKQKSIFWHARQICAISESNTHHGAWTNSIQPIWIAGKVMSHPSEHQAILHILDRIERETGWVTSWRREDLKTWWGDSDE